MKKDLRLSYEDRCQIHALWKRGLSHAEIAWDLGVHRATVGREKRRAFARNHALFYRVP